MKFMRSVCVFVCVKLTQFGSAFRREVSLWPTPLPLYHHSSSIPNYRGVHSRISHVSVLDSLINLTVCSYLKMLTNKCEHFNICTNNLLSLTDTYYDFHLTPHPVWQDSGPDWQLQHTALMSRQRSDWHTIQETETREHMIQYNQPSCLWLLKQQDGFPSLTESWWDSSGTLLLWTDWLILQVQHGFLKDCKRHT